MTKIYNVQITEVFYKDDYEEGEVSGTFQTIPLSTKPTTDLAKAIREFADAYGDKDGKVYVDDDVIHMDFMKCTDDSGCWRDPSEKEVEKWKKGEYELYNVEYQMRVWEMRPIEDKELREKLGELFEC